MSIIQLDHVTINSTDLEASVQFYNYFLGMKPGPRPDFAVGGVWLYPEGGDYPIVHLIDRKREAEGGKFDHIAFRHSGLSAYLAKVKASGTQYIAVPIEGTGLVQVQHRDPNHVLIEVNFFEEPIAPSDIVDPSLGRP